MKSTLRLVLGWFLILSPLQATEPDAFTQAELDSMLAPIALYPDALLAQILMASTYPLEVVEAARWSRANPQLDGTEAVEAAAARGWDPSVQALTAFPDVLRRMDADLTWTRRLGDAFLLQEEQVMETVQGLRRRAHAAGNLDRLEHVRVVREREVIVIEPANPRVIYLPYYQPTIVYGGWWWPAYPPVYWYAGPSYSQTVIYWSSGTRVSTFFYYSRPDWHRRHIVVVNRYPNPPVRVRDSGGHVQTRTVVSEQRWRHEPVHRRGVAYSRDDVSARYGRSTASGVTPPTRFRESEMWNQRTTVERHESPRERVHRPITPHPQQPPRDRASTHPWVRERERSATQRPPETRRFERPEGRDRTERPANHPPRNPTVLTPSDRLDRNDRPDPSNPSERGAWVERRNDAADRPERANRPERPERQNRDRERRPQP